ncbi:unnamed protein product [Ceutorhynchus assimilis]|uniref:Inositol-1-monophosphatase n=1 Tax=Ceutorhynchus assimilis TaxID=467358 RepID=A0A9N9QJS7_9CUCU|nr:unnamed protein product [Ceutorhynchus assimilis]
MEKVHEYYQFILPLVIEAGKVMKNVVEVKTELKNNDYGDIVTQYDRQIEEVLIRKIKDRYPTHCHIAEEEMSTKDEKPNLTDEPTWIIDPIDGTANFARGIAFTCVSVGLTINKEQVLGVVLNPYLDELFTAIKGEGAFLNGTRIFTSGCKDINTSTMNYEITIARNEKYYDLYMYRFKHLIKTVAGILAMGSAVMGLCYVACGKTDAYQCDGLYPWDAAAGTLIVREAGGFVSDSSGEEFDLMNPNFLATASEELCQQYLEVEGNADEEREQCLREGKEYMP